MPQDDTHPPNANGKASATSNEKSEKKAQLPKSTSSVTAERHAFFRLPRPLKQIFDKFPLKTYPANQLPRSSQRRRDKHALYVFIGKEGASLGHPSYNPACLKWQTYLRFSGVNHTLIPSNNHASPTGVLPFLLPAATSSNTSPSPVPSTKLHSWIETQTYTLSSQGPPSEIDLRETTYLTLLDHRIRPAYLHALYLTPSNFTSLVQPLYIQPATSSGIAQSFLSSQLHSAAFNQIANTSPSATPTLTSTSAVNDLYTEAQQAFSALSTLLGDDGWFYGQEKPGWFDACVFAYTFLILDREGILSKSEDVNDRTSGPRGWKDRRLKDILEGEERLVSHCDRIIEGWWKDL